MRAAVFIERPHCLRLEQDPRLPCKRKRRVAADVEIR
jgi:hypothetical protein